MTATPATPATLNRAQEILADAMTERELQRVVEGLLAATGWRFYHTHDSRRSVAGFPDLIAVRRGRVIVIELKTTRGRLAAAQREWLRDFIDAEIEAYVLRPRDWHSGLIEELLR